MAIDPISHEPMLAEYSWVTSDVNLPLEVKGNLSLWPQEKTEVSRKLNKEAQSSHGELAILHVSLA